MWSVQKVSLWPPACNILQVGRVKRAKRVKTPISLPPKTPNLPPPRGRLTHRHRKKKSFILCHYFLLSYYSLLFSLGYFQQFPLPLCFIYSRSTESHPSLTLFVPYFICSLCSLFISYSCFMMLPFFFVSSFLWCVIPLFPLFLNFNLPSILFYSMPSVHPSYHIEMDFCVMLAFFLSQNKINLPTLHFSPLRSFNPQPATLVSALFLWPSSSSETAGELLLKRTDRSTVKRNKRKDRFYLLKPQKLEREKNNNEGLSLRRRGLLFDH